MSSKSSASGTNRDSSFGLSPPTTGPLSLFLPSDIGMGGGSDFKGKGEASQSNRLAGQISVTIAEVYPNGTMLVRGEKLLTLDRKSTRLNSRHSCAPRMPSTATRNKHTSSHSCTTLIQSSPNT